MTLSLLTYGNDNIFLFCQYFNEMFYDNEMKLAQKEQPTFKR